MARTFVRWTSIFLPLFAPFACVGVGWGCGSPSTPTAPLNRPLGHPPVAAPAALGSHVSQAPTASSISTRATPEPEVSPPAPRVYATGRIAWVYEKPHRKSRKLGYVGLGMSVALREPTPRQAAEGCPRGFYAIEPRGFLCGNHLVTLDPSHPVIEALHEHVKTADGAFPFLYGLSLGAPMYNKLPDDETHRVVMMRYPKPRPLGDWANAFEDLVDPNVTLAVERVPEFLRDGKPSPNATDGFVRRALPHGSMLAFSKMFEHEGRRYLLADDLSAVPADRVRVYGRTEFRGVRVDENLLPPFGWVCGGSHPRYEQRDGRFVQAGQAWPNRAFVRLTDQSERSGKHSYRRLREGPWWIRSDHVCEVKLATKLPDGVTPSGKWLYVSTLEQTLVAYEGLRPVYATMHASGRGGVHRGKGDVRNYTTPLGGFHVN